jgi:hypothetical protein
MKLIIFGTARTQGTPEEKGRCRTGSNGATRNAIVHTDEQPSPRRVVVDTDNPYVGTIATARTYAAGGLSLRGDVVQEHVFGARIAKKGYTDFPIYDADWDSESAELTIFVVWRMGDGAPRSSLQ